MSLELLVHVGFGLLLLAAFGLLGYAAFWTVRNDWKRRQASRRLERRGGFIYDRDRDRLPL